MRIRYVFLPFGAGRSVSSSLMESRIIRSSLFSLPWIARGGYYVVLATRYNADLIFRELRVISPPRERARMFLS